LRQIASRLQAVVRQRTRHINQLHHLLALCFPELALLVKDVAQASLDLIYSGSRQIDDRKKDLAAKVEALRNFLENNAPADRHLVPDGVAFPLPEVQAAGLTAPQAQAAEPQ